jgi:hypothetical protein
MDALFFFHYFQERLKFFEGPMLKQRHLEWFLAKVDFWNSVSSEFFRN